MRAGLDHVHLFASDVAKTTEFFRTMFGASVVWDEEAAGVRRHRRALLAADGDKGLDTFRVEDAGQFGFEAVEVFTSRRRVFFLPALSRYLFLRRSNLSARVPTRGRLV